MNKFILQIIILLSLLFGRGNKIFSQEWETIYDCNPDISQCYFEDAIELSNGKILVASNNRPKNKKMDGVPGLTYHSEQPLLSLFSSDGTEIYRNEYDYFKPGLCQYTSPYLFERNGEIFFLTTYTPDHDINSKNYFKNQDSIPTKSIIGLYKLDEMLNVVESYEHYYPVDTFERRDEEWYYNLNDWCGHIYIYSAFEDEDYITGSYIKNESRRYYGFDYTDSVFFFKMDFEGNFLLRKGYEIDTVCGYAKNACYRQQMIKNDDGYVVYYRGCSLDHHGTVEYYDNDFNYVTTRYLIMPDDNWHGFMTNKLSTHKVMRSNHNTTYVSTTHQNAQDNGLYDIRLYEFDDDLNNSTEVLPVLNYIERRSPDHDRLPVASSIDMAKNGDIYFSYTLNCGFYDNKDSWIVIERLNSDFDTISTFFYDEVGIYNRATCITTTKDDGLLLVSISKDLIDYRTWSAVSKFPASAFVSIEEAHAHNLHLAVAYPNPGGDVMNIRTSLRDCTLHVYDMQGRMVHQQEITDDVTSVDASGWKSGTYVWELKMENGKLKVEEGKWAKTN